MLNLTWSLQCLAQLLETASVHRYRCIMSIIRLQFPLDMSHHGFHEPLYKIWEMLVFMPATSYSCIASAYGYDSFYAESFSLQHER